MSQLLYVCVFTYRHPESERKKNENLLATMQMKFSFENYAFTLALAHRGHIPIYIFDVDWAVLKKNAFFLTCSRAPFGWLVGWLLLLCHCYIWAVWGVCAPARSFAHFGRSFVLSIKITWMWQIFGWQHRIFCEMSLHNAEHGVYWVSFENWHRSHMVRLVPWMPPIIANTSRRFFPKIRQFFQAIQQLEYTSSFVRILSMIMTMTPYHTLLT